ncbi:MAG: hypothetical protein IJ207_12395 [Treponema sp.]|uniref:hypothetical protein n=1 Tax=Treponema sp. TaxID=166 RepID=UPI0025F791A4|nr:hypothetical protein [Treponema sp.]MBQ9282972.1 hypothetical protein [Treponema sp.]MBR1723214.1 hypothetical protein [Treponema sp.]
MASYRLLNERRNRGINLRLFYCVLSVAIGKTILLKKSKSKIQWPENVVHQFKGC